MLFCPATVTKSYSSVGNGPPLVAVVPGQLAALQLARLRGIDLDNPLGLSKVTLTR